MHLLVCPTNTILLQLFYYANWFYKSWYKTQIGNFSPDPFGSHKIPSKRNSSIKMAYTRAWSRQISIHCLLWEWCEVPRSSLSVNKWHGTETSLSIPNFIVPCHRGLSWIRFCGCGGIFVQEEFIKNILHFRLAWVIDLGCLGKKHVIYFCVLLGIHTPKEYL